MDRQDAAAMAEMMATLNASNTSLQETVKVLTTLVASMQQREQRLREVVAEQLQVVQHAASNADAKVNRVLENALPRLTQLTNQALTQTLEPAAKRFNSIFSRFFKMAVFSDRKPSPIRMNAPLPV